MKPKLLMITLIAAALLLAVITSTPAAPLSCSDGARAYPAYPAWCVQPTPTVNLMHKGTIAFIRANYPSIYTLLVSKFPDMRAYT
jgi:hypothetical protein